MTNLLRPFTGYVPTAEFASRVVGPSRSMLTDEQVEITKADPLNFRGAVGRGAQAEATIVRRWLDSAIADGAFAAFGSTVFAYRTTTDAVTATGIIAEVDLAGYRDGRVKGHEGTIAKNEAKMATYMRNSGILGNAVVLAHRPDARIAAAIATETRRTADLDFQTIEGARHELWVLDAERSSELCDGFDDSLYVIDGHHRLFAASLVADEDGDDTIPVAVFSTEMLDLRSFYRCVTDRDLDLDSFIEELGPDRLSPLDEPAAPTASREVAVRVGDDHYRLVLAEAADGADDVLGGLNVTLLRDQVLEPMLGLGDARHDRRMSFVANTPLEHGNEAKAHLSFLPYPVAIDDVLAVADAGQVLPPKSTWFAPKFPSGLVVRLRDRK